MGRMCHMVSCVADIAKNNGGVIMKRDICGAVKYVNVFGVFVVGAPTRAHVLILFHMLWCGHCGLGRPRCVSPYVHCVYKWMWPRAKAVLNQNRPLTNHSLYSKHIN